MQTHLLNIIYSVMQTCLIAFSSHPMQLKSMEANLIYSVLLTQFIR